MDARPVKQLYRILTRLVIVLAVIILLDKIIGSGLSHYYFSQKTGAGYRTTYSLDSTLADVIILGSSRATHHYVPQIFEDSLKMTFYNAGRDGVSSLYKYAVFKSITKRYSPKLIIYDLSPNELEYLSEDYGRLSILLPYYKTHPEIKSIIDLRNPLEEVKVLSSIYPYNSMLVEILLRNSRSFGEGESETQGYLPIYREMKYSKPDTLKTNMLASIDRNKVKVVEDIISTCEQKNIKLVLVFSPVWRIQEINELTDIIGEMCNEKGVTFINKSNDAIFMDNPMYFADPYHLNDNGARVFTLELLKEL